jgi:hypothetical protein
MNKQKILIALFLTAGLIAACSSDDERTAPVSPSNDGQPSADNVRPISVEVTQTPLTPDDPSARSMTTRSAVTTTETLSRFYMRGIYSNLTSEYTVSKSDDTWTVTPNTWPGGSDNDDPTPFYAFTDGTFYDNSGTPYISFTIAENASTQHDLLVAKNNVAYSDHSGKVPLTFNHACAALEFNVYMTNKLSTWLAGKTLTVSRIILRNVSNTGKYYFESSSWNDVSGSAYYTLANSDMNITTESQALSSKYLFVIPQSRDANGTTGTYLEINYTFSGQTQSTANIHLAVDWQAGKQYTINIKLGTSTIR